MNERIVAGRTEPPDMREKGKHGARSAGFTERRVIVHRSADRGAVPGPRRLLDCPRSFCAAVPLLKGAAFGFTGVLQKYRKVSQLLGSLSSLIHYLTLKPCCVSRHHVVSVVALVPGQKEKLEGGGLGYAGLERCMGGSWRGSGGKGGVDKSLKASCSARMCVCDNVVR